MKFFRFSPNVPSVVTCEERSQNRRRTNSPASSFLSTPKSKDAQVDGVLIGGDVFDEGVNPPSEAERMLNAFLDDCCGTGIPVILIGGNHDHPKRLAAQVRLLDRLRIYVRPEVSRPQAGGVIDLPSRD